jgi:hypothetical protein
MELDFAIDRRGEVDPTHAKLYAQLGDWIRKCYGTPVAVSAAGTAGVVLSKGAPFVLIIDVGATKIDRVVIQENQSQGQRILSYRVTAIENENLDVNSSTESAAVQFSSGSSVGNKRIDIVQTPVSGKIKLEVLSTALGLEPLVSSFAAYRPCGGG